MRRSKFITKKRKRKISEQCLNNIMSVLNIADIDLYDCELNLQVAKNRNIIQ
jgi:hypothetical protein